MTDKKLDAFEQERAEEAWAKMASKLKDEPVNPAWNTWNDRLAETHKEEMAGAALTGGFAEGRLSESAASDKTAGIPHSENAEPIVKNGFSNRKKGKRAARLTIAAAAAALAIAVVTPAGNEALASVLNKFTMQDTVVVQESDMENMFRQIAGPGESHEAANRYGTFTSISGTVGGGDPLTAEQIKEQLGYEVVKSEAIQPTEGYSVSPSSQEIMKLNVDEMNKTLKRLGAEYLFPAEADGKAITITQPAAVYYALSSESDEEEGRWGSLSQTRVPTIEFDPSFPVEDTMRAVINFPYLPQSLRDGLQQAALSSGSLPLPMYADGEAKQIEVEGTIVTYSRSEFGEQRSAFWIKDGDLFQMTASDTFFGGEQGFLDAVKGLVAQ